MPDDDDDDDLSGPSRLVAQLNQLLRSAECVSVGIVGIARKRPEAIPIPSSAIVRLAASNGSRRWIRRRPPNRELPLQIIVRQPNRWRLSDRIYRLGLWESFCGRFASRSAGRQISAGASSLWPPLHATYRPEKRSG